MRTRSWALCATGCLVLGLAVAAPRVLASHVPTPPPPALEFVGVEPYESPSAPAPGVLAGYWHVFNVTSSGGADWVTGHNGNAYKLWKRDDSGGETSFQWIQGWAGSGQASYQIRALIGPAEFEWTNSFHVTEVGGVSFQQETGPSNEVQVTTPMPPVIIDLHNPTFPAAGFHDGQQTRPVSYLPTLLELSASPTIRMIVYGFNFAWPESAWQYTGEIPANYPRPRVRWNGEVGLVSGEQKFPNGWAIQFDVPRDLLQDPAGTATIDLVQGTGQVVSPEPYVLTLAPPPPELGPRNVAAVADGTKPAKKRTKVQVTWDPPTTGAPSEYVIERRVVPDVATEAGKTVRAEGLEDFVQLGTVAGDTLQYLDKKALPDEVYEYRVASRVAQLNYAQPDEAWTTGRGLRYYEPDIDLWHVPWRNVVIDDEELDVDTLEALHTFDFNGYGVRRRRPFDQYRLEAPGIEILCDLSGASRSRTRVRMDAEVIVRIDHADEPLWARDIEKGDKGSLELEMEDDDAFDDDTYVEARGVLELAAGSWDVSMRREGSDGASEVNVDIGATVGAARKEIAPGGRVVVVFECISISQALLAGTTWLDVKVDNGHVVEVLPPPFSTGIFFPTADPAGEDEVRFEAGALGPDAKGKARVATLALSVEADSITTSRAQLRCTFRLERNPSGRDDTFKGEQRARLLSKGSTRVVEVAIVGTPVAAKDR